jgi:integrase
VTVNTYEETYALYINKHLKPFFGEMRLKDIKPADIQLSYNNKKVLSESALNKIQICLTGIFRTAIENELCSKNPTEFISPSSCQIRRKKCVYSAQQEKYIRELSIDKMPGIVLCLETGLRPGEFTGLRRSDIKDGVLYVNRSIAYSNR